MKKPINTIAICNIKKTAKEILITQLKTGDIIKVKSEILPIINHYGIVYKDKNSFIIYHNDPFFNNKKGGNIISENVLDWIKGKEIIEVTSTNVTEAELIETIKTCYEQKYNWLNFNCEHFVFLFKKKDIFSPQVVGWTIAVSSIILAGLILFKKQK